MKRWILLVVAASFGAAGLWAMDDDQGDTIQILAIDPSGPVKRGVETEFKIDVEATLNSPDEGVSMVGFNVESPVKFKMVDSRILNPGFQQFTFTVKIVPTDWGERAKFIVNVNMGPKIEGTEWEPTAWDKRSILVVP